MSESVTGYIDHIIFRNEDNGYTVLVLKGTEGDDEELTCVGTFPVISQGATIEASGNFINHHIYGKQFQITSFTEKCLRMPWQWSATLAPGLLRGSERLWLPGSSAGLGQILLGSWKKSPSVWLRSRESVKKGPRDRCSDGRKGRYAKSNDVLQKYGISLNLGAKIYQKYGDSVYSVLQENPYRLADDISGVGFKIADEIAGRIGIHTDSDYRIKSGMMYTLLQATGEGHVYLPKEELFQRSSELLGVDVSYMEKHLMDLSMERKVIQKEEGETVLVYPSRFYYLELNTARMLSELNIDCPEDEAFVQRRIAQIEKETGTTLDEMQKKQ